MPLQEIFQSFLSSFFQIILLLINPVVLIPVIIVIVVLAKKNKEYKNSAYYQITKLPYLSVRNDIGRYGEYYTYKRLRHFESEGSKFLFNIYIPKDNDETTEIDVLMISPKGLFVFESKNYSGWIFGSENQKNWYQTLPAGRGRSHKENFYNPIMQNRSHIKHLKAFLGTDIPVRSIIVFSDRCTLKNVKITSNDISVINRYNVNPVVSAICNQSQENLLSAEEISNIYNKLYPCSQIDVTTKVQHITNIHNKINPTPVQQVDVPEDITQTNNDISENSSTVSQETENTAETSQELKCPKCGADLIIRIATRGANAGKQFYGCSNYPKCRYIENIK